MINCEVERPKVLACGIGVGITGVVVGSTIAIIGIGKEGTKQIGSMAIKGFINMVEDSIKYKMENNIKIKN